MVTQFRRHEKDCKYANRKTYPEPRKHKDCTCPVAMDGYVTMPSGERIVMRGSLDTRNWEHARIKLDSKVQPLLRGDQTATDISVADAIEKFLNVKRNSLPPRNDRGHASEAVILFREREKKRLETERKKNAGALADREQDQDQEQVRKYRDVLVPLKVFAAKHGLTLLKQIKVDHLDQLLQSMKGRPIFKDGVTVGNEPKTQGGKQRYQQNLGIFFKFALDRSWITTNPAKALDRITVPESTIIPYTDEEWGRIRGSIDGTFPRTHHMVRAYVLLLKNSALRMGDVTKFGPKDHPKGAVNIVMEKTKEPVWVPLPKETIEALNSVERKSQNHYFWTGNGDLETAKKDWSAIMLRLFRAANIEGGSARRSHNFRKTMASQLVEHEDGSLEDAQMLLGHKKLSTTQKSYAHFGPKKKERLAALLKKLHAVDA